MKIKVVELKKEDFNIKDDVKFSIILSVEEYKKLSDLNDIIKLKNEN